MSKDLTACEEFMELITIHVMTAMGGDSCHHMHKTNSLATICGNLPPAFVLCVCVCGGANHLPHNSRTASKDLFK